MANIRPFRGIVYNEAKVKASSRVAAPPYDIISKDMQQGLYRRSPYSVVRLILGKTKKTDGVKDNRYTRARRFFKTWLKSGIMRQDRDEAIYVYSQSYNDRGREIYRIGFIALLKLNREKRRVLAHENTLLAPKLDRLNLIREVKANLSPIFVLYEDRPHKISNMLKRFSLRNKPFIDIDLDGVRHKAWRLNDARLVKAVEAFMRPKDIFIADGHHRYEVALTYSIEVQDKSKDKKLKKNSRYMMAYFVESDEEMLTILPAHRLIRDMGILDEGGIKERLGRFFHIEKADTIELVMSRLDELSKTHVFGIYLGRDKFYVLRMKDTKFPNAVIKNNSRAWKRLDVTILHLFILEYVLGIRDDDDNVEFVKDAEKAIDLVDSGVFKIAFFLNPTTVSQVKEIARLGERMPRKATYFYPKPLSGLVINKLD